MTLTLEDLNDKLHDVIEKYDDQDYYVPFVRVDGPDDIVIDGHVNLEMLKSFVSILESSK